MSIRASPLGQWDFHDSRLLHYVVARVMQMEPSTAVTLLQLNSTFHRATAEVLYEELYIQDIDSVIFSPPPCTRHEAVQKSPRRYAGLVRTLVLIPSSNPHPASHLFDGRCFSDFDLPCFSSPILPESLRAMLKSLPRLEAFVWATDRMPFAELCQTIHSSSPRLTELLIRPTTSEFAHSHHRLASSQETVQAAPLQRWEALNLTNISSLQVLSISGLSVDGIRQLQKFVQGATRLSQLHIDSQFVDDALLMQVSELRLLRELLIKSSGTKLTDKGLLAVLEGSETLQRLTLTEVEGRLNKSFWGRAAFLPPNFLSLRLAFNEEGPHHSWVTDHLLSVFDVLPAAPRGLQTFSLTRLTPKGELIPVTCHTQEGMVLRNGNGESEQATMLKRFFSNACDEVVRPRPFPDGAFAKIINFGSNLETLELDIFVMTVCELRGVLESCRKLRYLRILLNAPLTRVLSMSSAFVPLTFLHTLVLSVTDAHCPKQALMVKTQASKTVHSAPSSTLDSPISRRASEVNSIASVSENSPALTYTSLAQSESETVSPSSSPRQAMARARKASISQASAALQNLTMNTLGLPGVDDIAPASVQGITGNVGTFDTSVPPKRDIRKFARRCPSLAILRWAGRQGKGEWRIAAGSSSIHANIDFVPVHLVEDEEAERLTLGSGADVEDFIKRKRAAHCAHPGKQQRQKEETEGALSAGLTVVSPFEGSTTSSLGDATPRLDGRKFPRLKPAASTAAVQEGPGQEVVRAATKAGKEAERETALMGSGKNCKPRSVPTLSFGQVTRAGVGANEGVGAKTVAKTSRPAKSYASISDPAHCRTNHDVGETARAETKMAVLGEPGRKRGGNNGKATASGVQQSTVQTTSPAAKARTVTKVRGPEDGYSGTTIIIGQGKATSTTGGAATRRTRKKAGKGEEEGKGAATRKATSEGNRR